MRRALRLHRIFMVQELKKLLEYRGDFITGMLGLLSVQVFNVVFLSVIFSQIPNLVGWSFEQVMFIYGFSLIPKGLDHLLFDNLWVIGYFTVRKGEFDKYLTRPINPLFHVLVERFQIEAFGELIIGVILLVYSLPKLIIQLSLLKILLMILVIPFCAFIYTSIKIVTASLAFWIKKSGSIVFMFYMINDFSKYPVTIYNNVLKNILTYVIPFALTAYYPANYFLTGENPIFNIGMPILVSCVFLILSVCVWNKGVGAYESAGS